LAMHIFEEEKIAYTSQIQHQERAN